MYNCPSCGKENSEHKNVCDCGVDLTLLQCIESLTASWFNRALDAAKSGQYGQAVELLSACCIANPSDAEAFRLRTKAWLGLSRPLEAKRSCEKVRELDPDCPELAQLTKTIELLEKKSSHSNRKRSSGKTKSRKK